MGVKNASVCVVNKGLVAPCNCKHKRKFVIFLSFCMFRPLLSHTSICPPTDCVQFQDHDFVLGSLADFPAVLLEEFLADKHFVRLSVLSQAQLAEFLPMQEEDKEQKGKTVEGREGKYE